MTPVSVPELDLELMESTTPVADMFKDRYTASGRSTMSLGNIDKLMEEISRSVTSGKEIEQSSYSAPQLLRQKWNKLHWIGTLQLLAAIKDALYVEEPKLSFNYFGMHKRCIDILRLIRAKEHHKFLQYFTTGYMPDETLTQCRHTRSSSCSAVFPSRPNDGSRT